jgi:hypothetical protein
VSALEVDQVVAGFRCCDISMILGKHRSVCSRSGGMQLGIILLGICVGVKCRQLFPTFVCKVSRGQRSSMLSLSLLRVSGYTLLSSLQK